MRNGVLGFSLRQLLQRLAPSCSLTCVKTSLPASPSLKVLGTGYWSRMEPALSTPSAWGLLPRPLKQHLSEAVENQGDLVSANILKHCHWDRVTCFKQYNIPVLLPPAEFSGHSVPFLNSPSLPFSDLQTLHYIVMTILGKVAQGRTHLTEQAMPVSGGRILQAECIASTMILRQGYNCVFEGQIGGHCAWSRVI